MSKRLYALATALLIIIFMCSANVSANITGYVTASKLNIRAEGNTYSAIVATASYGDAVNVLSTDSAWYSVEYGGIQGYAYSGYLNLQSPEAAASESPADAHEGEISVGQSLVEYSKNFIGTPYRYGANGPGSFDCSGFVKYVYGNFGISLPRTSYSMMNCGTSVYAWELQPGDLVFFRGGGHVGIYVGNNSYIHAPQTGRTVSIDSLDRGIYAARRIL